MLLKGTGATGGPEYLPTQHTPVAVPKEVQVRVLVSSTPGYGHVLPMVPLARALLAAGHEVLWATAADACQRVAAAGIEVTAAGITEEQLGDTRRAIMADAAGLRPEQLAGHVFPRMFGAARTPPMLTELLPVAQSWRPDLLVHEQGELAGPLVAELVGVPHVTHAFGGAAPAAIVADAAEQVATLWAQHGTPMPPYAGCFDHLYIDICPTGLQTVSLDHVGEIQQLRPVSYTGEPVALPAGVTRDDPRPLVYLTLGTVQSRPDLLRTVVAALGELDVRLLVTVGPRGDPAAFGALPPNVMVERYVSQAAVLPLCAAVVSHAGSGTVLGAAGLGLPQVCLPQAADQFRNTEGLVRAGAGIGLHPDQVDSAAVAEAVRKVLDDPAIRAGAGRLSQEIAAMPGPGEVVTRLEELVSPG
jgi:UDP:flavonoid glycosyltransferase YjiC (YdhE family)